VQRNELLFQKGDRSVGMYIMLMGQVKLVIPASSGNEKVVHVAGPGSTFGEAVVFLDKPYPVSAYAVQDSLVLLMEKAGLLAALDGSRLLSRKMLASLSVRLHQLIDDMENCTLRNSVERVVHYLAEHTRADGDVVHLEVSKLNLASRLSLAPETFSRILGRLADAGLIEVRGRDITVRERDRLIDYRG